MNAALGRAMSCAHSGLETTMAETGIRMTGEVLQLLEEAYCAAKKALILLDQAGAPANIGAHIEHGLGDLATLLEVLGQKCA